MNKVLEDLKDMKTMVIDVRFNGGGQDIVSLEILRRFTDKKRKVAFKKAVLGSNYTSRHPIYLKPAPKPYTKPVYILTSQQTASAGDFFSLASVSMENVKRIGSHTYGAISDALEKNFPMVGIFLYRTRFMKI